MKNNLYRIVGWVLLFLPVTVWSADVKEPTSGELLRLPVTVWSADVKEPTSGIAALALQANGDKLDDFRIKVGDVEVHPHVGTTFTYDDNVTISGSNPQGDFYALVSPGVQFRYEKGENTISFDYTASIERFFRLSGFDTVDHNAALMGSFMIGEKLRLTVSQGFSRSMGGETRDQVGIPIGQIGERIPGTRTELQNFTTMVGAEYEISQKTAVGLDFSMSHMEYINLPGLIGNDTYDVRIPFYYHLSKKTDVFLDANVGTASEQRGANQIYEGFGVGVRTRLTGKINGNIRVGYQHRDYNGGGISSVDTVVASANADWAIGPRTALIAGINRSVNPASAAVNNYYTSTALDVTLRQRVWRDKITFSMGGGYERDDYGMPFATFTGSGVSSNRSDDYYYLKVGGDYTIRKWWSAGANYRFRSSCSSLSAYDFDNNMVSVYTRVSF